MIFLRDSLCLSAVTLSRQQHDILDFSLVTRFACDIGNWQDLSFIGGHHHLSECMDISRPAEYFIACYTALSKQLSTVAILGFQYGLYCCLIKLFT